MKRVMIIGDGGSGKSTLARLLGAQTGLACTSSGSGVLDARLDPAARSGKAGDGCGD